MRHYPAQGYALCGPVNDVDGKSTVAHADVAGAIMSDCPENRADAVQMVRRALHKSLGDGHSYMVGGDNS